MGILDKAKDLIARLEGGRTVNSQEYGQVYKELTGKQWKYTNCAPCIKDNNNEMRKKISELEKDGGCLGCKKQINNNDTNINVTPDNRNDSEKSIQEPVQEIVDQLQEMNVEESKIEEIVNNLDVEFPDELIPKSKKVIKKKKK